VIVGDFIPVVVGEFMYPMVVGNFMSVVVGGFMYPSGWWRI
jgi:hypothetical protein